MISYRNNLSALAIVAALGGAIGSALPAYALTFVPTQSAGEQSTASLIGLKVENTQGENLGDINYLVLDSAGAVTTAVIGVGGFLGIGEKNVGVPFGEVKMVNNKDGKPIAMVAATKDSLTSAPNYVWTEKTTMQQMKDDAGVAVEKAKKAMSSDTDKQTGTVTPTPGPAATP